LKEKQNVIKKKNAGDIAILWTALIFILFYPNDFISKKD